MFKFSRKEKVAPMAYCVQVVRTTFTNETVKEITSAEFNCMTSSTEEVILVNSNMAQQVLSMDKWPFTVKTDGSFKTIYVAYANEKSGVTKIECYVVDSVASEVEEDLNANNGIIRITKDK